MSIIIWRWNIYNACKTWGFSYSGNGKKIALSEIAVILSLQFMKTDPFACVLQGYKERVKWVSGSLQEGSTGSQGFSAFIGLWQYSGERSAGASFVLLLLFLTFSPSLFNHAHSFQSRLCTYVRSTVAVKQECSHGLGGIGNSSFFYRPIHTAKM